MNNIVYKLSYIDYINNKNNILISNNTIKLISIYSSHWLKLQQSNKKCINHQSQTILL